MDGKRKVERLIRDRMLKKNAKQQKLDELRSNCESIEREITLDQVAIQSYQEALQHFPDTQHESESGRKRPKRLRQGSEIAHVENIIREAGHPMTISDILQRLNKEVSIKNRNALSRSIGLYVSRGKYFTRTGRNEFGLSETQNDESCESNPVSDVNDAPETRENAFSELHQYRTQRVINE